MDPVVVQQTLERQQQAHEHSMRQVQKMVSNMLAAQQTAADNAAARCARLRQQISSVIDPKILQRITTFSGKDDDFPEWEVRHKSLCGLIGLDEAM